jgi:hypothetical protein
VLGLLDNRNLVIWGIENLQVVNGICIMINLFIQIKVNFIHAVSIFIAELGNTTVQWLFSVNYLGLAIRLEYLEKDQDRKNLSQLLQFGSSTGFAVILCVLFAYLILDIEMSNMANATQNEATAVFWLQLSLLFIFSLTFIVLATA